MTSHRDSAHPLRSLRRALGSARSRALLALAGVAALALGVGLQGTFAFWSDKATVTTGSFSSGTLDITLNGQLQGIANNGGTWTNTAYGLTNLSPGESFAFGFPVANAGTTGLTYTVTGTGTGDLAVANGMQFTVYFGVTATNSGSAGSRAGACGGTTPTGGTVLTPTSTTLVATPRALTATTGTENVCIVARLDPNAPNSLQNKSMTASITFDSKQVGAP